MKAARLARHAGRLAACSQPLAASRLHRDLSPVSLALTGETGHTPDLAEHARCRAEPALFLSSRSFPLRYGKVTSARGSQVYRANQIAWALLVACVGCSALFTISVFVHGNTHHFLGDIIFYLKQTNISFQDTLLPLFVLFYRKPLTLLFSILD